MAKVLNCSKSFAKALLLIWTTKEVNVGVNVFVDKTCISEHNWVVRVEAVPAVAETALTSAEISSAWSAEALAVKFCIVVIFYLL